jgi:hypothetical protein
MEPNDQDIVYAIRPLGERVASLESRQEATDEKLDKIVNKLDELLELKMKGAGAVKLISLLVASAAGVMTVIGFLMSLFGKH